MIRTYGTATAMLDSDARVILLGALLWSVVTMVCYPPAAAEAPGPISDRPG